MDSRYIRILALLLVAAAAAAAADADEFDGVQSPIDIKTNNVSIVDLPDLSFKHYHSSQSAYYIANSGHGAKVTLTNWKYKPRVKGGPLASRYILEQVHFHWGQDDGVGSEHYVDRSPFSMEAHLVHYNSKYSSFEEASTKNDGLAVVAFFLEGLSNYRNRDFQKLVNVIPKISKISENNEKVLTDADLLTWALPHLEANGYYTYKGSLTTEPYSANVVWIVYENPVVIGRFQILPFRAIENDHEEALSTNFRTLQENGRAASVRYVPYKA